MRSAGVVGVILKATEGLTIVDDKYLANKKAALEAGLLVGAYHFAHAGDPIDQAKFFLKHADWDGYTLFAHDWEDPPHGPPMSLSDTRRFVEYIYQVTGQRPVIYSGNTAKRLMGDVEDDYIGQHRLWLASYTETYHYQPSWTKHYIWQFTGDNLGPNLPRRVAGVQGGGIDLNTGDPGEIVMKWTGGRKNKDNTGDLPDDDVANNPKIGLDDLGVGVGGVAVLTATDWLTALVVIAILGGIFVWWKYFKKPAAPTA